MPKFCTLFSGSSGNCTFISDGKTNLLVDAGVSASRICSALAEIGYTPYDIDGILLTHEHRDHVSGVNVMSRNFSIPVYANAGTMEKTLSTIGCIFDDYIHTFRTNEKFTIGDIDVFPFSIPHDTVDPVGYTFRFGGEYYSVATDIGYITDNILKHLCRSKAVLIESNHDVDMLKTGPYPYPLKQRILSDKGHLSNVLCGELCIKLAESGTKSFWLGHLSEKNNVPEIAYRTVHKILTDKGYSVGTDIALNVIPKNWIEEKI